MPRLQHRRGTPQAFSECGAEEIPGLLRPGSSLHRGCGGKQFWRGCWAVSAALYCYFDSTWCYGSSYGSQSADGDALKLVSRNGIGIHGVGGLGSCDGHELVSSRNIKKGVQPVETMARSRMSDRGVVQPDLILGPRNRHVQ